MYSWPKSVSFVHAGSRKMASTIALLPKQSCYAEVYQCTHVGAFGKKSDEDKMLAVKRSSCSFLRRRPAKLPGKPTLQPFFSRLDIRSGRRIEGEVQTSGLRRIKLNSMAVCRRDRCALSVKRFLGAQASMMSHPIVVSMEVGD